MNLKDVNTSSMLEKLGLERKRTTPTLVLRTFGLLAMGIVSGLGLGLLLAPREGREWRRDVGRRIKARAARVAGRAHEVIESTQMAGA